MIKSISKLPNTPKDKLFIALISKKSFFLMIASILSFLISFAFEAERFGFYNASIAVTQINPVVVVLVFLIIFTPKIITILLDDARYATASSAREPHAYKSA